MRRSLIALRMPERRRPRAGRTAPGLSRKSMMLKRNHAMGPCRTQCCHAPPPTPPHMMLLTVFAASAPPMPPQTRVRHHTWSIQACERRESRKTEEVHPVRARAGATQAVSCLIASCAIPGPAAPLDPWMQSDKDAQASCVET